MSDFLNKATAKIFAFCASLRLAVIVILSLAVISAVGTITEARWDSEVAQALVYHSYWMYAIMITLMVNLIAVMIDRWPWKQHHAGFVLAHVGIIILLIGSYVTQRQGIDGSMAFQIGEERRQVQVKERDLLVYASFGDGGMQNVYDGAPDFLREPPSEKRPFVVNLGQEQMKFVEYHHFAFREEENRPSPDALDGPAIRIQLENPNVNMTEWLRRERGRDSAELDLGPAKFVLTKAEPRSSGRNEVIFRAREGDEALEYVIFDKTGKLRLRGKIRQSETITTPWMGLQVRLLRYLPHAYQKVTYAPADGGSPIATSAARFLFRGKEYWIGLNSPLRIYLDDRMYLVSYGHRMLRLDFPLKLVKFSVGMYEGTERAASYESLVEVPGRGEVKISMNEPLKHDGFTFYQASFERNERGEPVVSVLSVNHDPGRGLKYLGSLLIVLGSIVLFYFKRVKWLQKIRKTA